MTCEVLILGGGPDLERPVSLQSAGAVAQALRSARRYAVHEHEIERITLDELRALPGDVIWPVLHGRWGEGGPLQDLLEADGRPYVGSVPRAARLAMDKIAARDIASRLNLRTAPACILNPADPGRMIDLPLVVKPVFEGSTLGLRICRTEEDWRNAHRAAVESGRIHMVERFIAGRECTAGLIDIGEGLTPLPLIEITPASGLYDYEAKYTRNDTLYTVSPQLPAGVAEGIAARTLSLAQTIGVRHLCRADYILDDENHPWFLEINTMPGFTSHSLVPMAAASIGLDMTALCAAIVDRALSEVAQGV